MINITEYEKLSRSFYIRPKVVQIAEELVGKYIFTNVNDVLTVGKIVETEAYNGNNDKASHAFGKRTKRTEIMYGNGGYAYVYLCYGIHHMFNVVTNIEGRADAVLVRAIEPVYGINTMIERRGGDKEFKLTSGPGSLSTAVGIRTEMTGSDLCGNLIWIAKKETELPEIERDRRVGVDYAGEDAVLPWRFFIKSNPWVSKTKQFSKSF